jgi:hypothetical protein
VRERSALSARASASQVERLDDAKLAEIVGHTTVFAKGDEIRAVRPQASCRFILGKADGICY